MGSKWVLVGTFSLCSAAHAECFVQLNSPPQFVPLDLTVVKPDNILLYDSFFEIVVHHGSTVAVAWRGTRTRSRTRTSGVLFYA